jgi:hypothetical protein
MMMTNIDSNGHNRSVALLMAGSGMPVFPCNGQKKPYINGWPNESTTDPDKISQLWEQYPDAVPAIDLGKTNLFVVDCDRNHKDGEDGVETFFALADKNGGIDGARRVRTPNGGLHIYFRQPNGAPLRNQLPSVDWRGDGGYVIAPRSKLPDGCEYIVETPSGRKLPVVPQWFIDIARKPQRPAEGSSISPAAGSREGKYALAALQSSCVAVAAAPSGQRNHTLNAAAFSLGKMVSAGWISENFVRSALLDASAQCGLPNDEATKTIASGIAAGRFEPLTALPEKPLAAAALVADYRASPLAAGPLGDDGPLPLFSPIPDAAPYPVKALGSTLSEAATAIASKVQVPLAMAAQSVLAAASLVASAHADVMMPYGQSRPLCLFFVTVAASGDRKSTADNEALWPIREREKALRDEHKDLMKAWRVEFAAWSAQKRKIEGKKDIGLPERRELLKTLGDEPAKPLSPFLVTGDLTVEGLLKCWPDAHASLGIFTAEGATFTAGHGMNDDNRLKTAANLSELWDGKPVVRLRAGDGVSILSGRRMSMHVMIQPDAAGDFLSNGTLRDQGLLSRVLAAAPASLAGSRSYKDAHPRDVSAIKSYKERLLSILQAAPALAPSTRNELEPPALQICRNARANWRAFYDDIEERCGSAGDLAPVRDFAAKAAEHAARIAGVLAIVEDLHTKEIGDAPMRGALEIVGWYVDEASRLQQVAKIDLRLRRAASLLQWLQGQPKGEASISRILNAGPGATRTKKLAEEALTILQEHGLISQVSNRPRTVKINPGASANSANIAKETGSQAQHSQHSQLSHGGDGPAPADTFATFAEGPGSERENEHVDPLGDAADVEVEI